MLPFSTLLSGIRTAEGLLSQVLGKRGTRLNHKIAAVVALQKAINATRAFLVHSEMTYSPNEALSHLWLDAFEKMIRIDKSLARDLRATSNFWSNPQLWLQEKSAMELVPDLQELNERCDQILVQLEKRLKN